VEDRDLLNVFRGRARGKGRGSGEGWVLLVEEKLSDEVVKIDLTDVFPEHLERGARVLCGWVKVSANIPGATYEKWINTFLLCEDDLAED